MTDEDLKAETEDLKAEIRNLKDEIERLRMENEALRKSNTPEISMKVSQKGALSVYGLGRFPVTLYKEQWFRLLEKAEDIRNFIKENDSELKGKS